MAPHRTPVRMLIAGMGNVLQADDGFGVAVADRLAREQLPPGVEVVEVGIGGIHLVQHLHAGYDALVIVDAVERGGAPGTVYVLEASVPEIDSYTERERHEFMTDIHYTVPSKVLLVARALDCLPPHAWIVGCQPLETERPGIGLSPDVERAVPEAITRVREIVAQLFASEVESS